MTVINKESRAQGRSPAQDEKNPKAVVAKTSTTLADRRREARYPCNKAVQVRNLTQNEARLSARIIEISRSGLRLELPAPVTKGSQVEILMSKEVAIFGKVRHCRAVGEKYHAGVQIEEVYYASQNAEHLSTVHLTKYVSGTGLTIPQAIRVREHLAHCDACRLRMVESYSTKQEPRKTVL
ncbi:MAG TPA: PilZ domain-containing protein [Bryobacteraceae bacterium]